MPLPVVYDGVRQPELDIVSIPGLPTLNPQYKLKDHNDWLREVLSHQIPRARIMAFQYDFGKKPAEPSWIDLLAYVDQLLYALIHRREATETRPIVFVCYSFGAFILKKALLVAKERRDFYNILEKTGGIVFLGCLNNEDHPDFEELCLKCAAVEFGTSKRHNTIGSLKNSGDWNTIKQVMESFRVLPSPFPVRIIYELKETSIPDRIWIVKGKSEKLCSERISSLGWTDERLIGVQKDHGELTMYPHRGDREGFFKTFMDTLTELVDMVSPQAKDLTSDENHQGTIYDATWSLLSTHGSTTSLRTTYLDSPSSVIDPALPPSHTSSRTIRLPCFVLHPYEENPNFVGRKEVHDAIHATLDPSVRSHSGLRTFALTGLGGMGKTQIAISYAYRHKDLYKVVLWAHADGQSKLAESFSLFAAKLGLGNSLPLTQAKQAVKDCLKTLNVPWLLILDNADGDDKQELLREFCPDAGNGSILITSRDHTLATQYVGLSLGKLDKDSAVSLLFKLTVLNRAQMPDETMPAELEAAGQIVHRIGFLPLGISQAATIILKDSCSMADFFQAYSLRELISDCEDVHVGSGDTTYKYSLRTVWDMNYDRLSEDQQSLLKLLSFLDPDRIQMQLFRDGAEKVDDRTFEFLTAYKLAKSKSGLLQSSLVYQSDTKKDLRMHRLVGASCQLRMDQMERQHNFKNAVRLIKAVWPVPPRISVHNPGLWEKQRALLPHAQKLCEFYVAYERKGLPLIPEDEVNWDFASVLYEAGWFCYESGLLHSVSDLLQPAEKYSLRHLHRGGGYRILADVYGGLGSLDTESNQFQGAYDNFKNHYQYVQLALDHDELQRPSIWEVFALGRLGNGNHGLHRYVEAESYYRQCLTAWEKLPGDRKIFTTHLATCLWLQDRLEEAETVVRSIIKDQNDTSNFRTAMAMYSLGNIQIAQAEKLTLAGNKNEAESKYAEAMEIHVKVLSLWTITLGARHHKTADAAHKVGWHLHRMNEYQRACDMFGEALSIYEEQPRLFPNEISRTKYKLGCTQQDMGMAEKGSQVIREAEALRQQIVPPENWEPATGERDLDEIVQFWTR
ncbi:putative NB-ARC domain-containing protein [Seiridium cardinale]|uniref:NB-ARC domain-containing protein n=1 Tax=Seiridium cardinale TaxID=138064 RepID=A0ABR2X866_9PEZI